LLNHLNEFWINLSVINYIMSVSLSLFLLLGPAQTHVQRFCFLKWNFKFLVSCSSIMETWWARHFDSLPRLEQQINHVFLCRLEYRSIRMHCLSHVADCLSHIFLRDQNILLRFKWRHRMPVSRVPGQGHTTNQDGQV
jgi:hypothetical protein